VPAQILGQPAADNWGSSFADRCIDAVRQALSMGLCRPGAPETFAHCFLWSLVSDAFLKGLSGQDRLACEGDRDAHLETVWGVFIDGIAPT
jgi:hypothetical protein